MRDFTAHRGPGTEDQLWVLEHAAVYTLGQAGKSSHILNAMDIPVVHTDRGGQVTYHGPGQLVFYLMADLHALGLGVRKLVQALEQAVINVLAAYAITAEGSRDAPGVYVQGAKIAALGLRVSRGCSYHGLSFNYDMDLSPFSRINPCGYERLPVTQFATLQSACQNPGPLPSKFDLADQLVREICRLLGYASVSQDARRATSARTE